MRDITYLIEKFSINIIFLTELDYAPTALKGISDKGTGV